MFINCYPLLFVHYLLNNLICVFLSIFSYDICLIVAGPCYAVILGIYSLSFSSPLLNKSERKDRMHYTWITGWQTAQHMAPILLGWAWESSINSTKACMVLKAQRKEMGSCWRAVGQTIWEIRVKGRQRGSLFVKIFRKIKWLLK